MTPVVVPPDKATGCLLRSAKPGALCGLWGESMEVIPVQEWPDLIGSVEISSYVPVVLDQGQVGSCATESTAGSVMLSRVITGQLFELLNPWFIYFHTSGGRDAGSSIDENLEWVRDHGIAPESVWPRSKGWQTKPTPEAYEAAQRFRIMEFWDLTTIAEIGSALLKGFPVVFGFKTSGGGHSCLFTELVNINEADYLNSWSASWGRNGLGRLRLTSVNFAYGAFAVRAVL
jgi:hypothetical protein